jgi:hypothetical protein
MITGQANGAGRLNVSGPNVVVPSLSQLSHAVGRLGRFGRLNTGMSRQTQSERKNPLTAYFTALSFDSVTTALVEEDVITIAKDYDSVVLPLEVAVEIAAETLRMLLDEKELRNHRGQALADYLGTTDESDLRYILSRISDPEGPTFTRC